jgi:hypothetical protein
MSEFDGTRIKAGLLVAIAIRSTILLKFPEIVSTWIGQVSAFVSYRNSTVVSAAAEIPRVDLDRFLVVISSLALFLGLVLVFILAEKIGERVCGPQMAFSFDGNVDHWQEAILQFMGIAIFIGGLTKSGSIVSEIVKVDRINELNGIQNYAQIDPRVWISVTNVAVSIVAGILLAAFPGPLMEWLNTRRGKRDDDHS